MGKYKNMYIKRKKIKNKNMLNINICILNEKTKKLKKICNITYFFIDL